MITEVQGKTLTTNNMQNKISDKDVSQMWRLSDGKEETVTHRVSVCSLARMTHWKLCEKWEFEGADKRYEQKQEKY